MPPLTPEEILEKRLTGEAERSGETVDAVRARLLLLGLVEAKAARERQAAAAAATVDVLLVTATMTEHRELRDAARLLGIPFEKRPGRFGAYYHLGKIGTDRVASMQVEMGAFGAKGSAARCMQARAETHATTLVLVGTAFGVDRRSQRIGDVLVSESVFLYEDRHVVDDTALGPHKIIGGAVGWALDKAGAGSSAPARTLSAYCRPGYLFRYPTSRRLASASWVGRFRRIGAELARGGESFRVLVGAILSGGSRMESGRFVDELMAGIPAMDTPIVGGEMEAAGVVSASPSTEFDEPGWIVVKGIADFADGPSRAEIEQNRGGAARAAAQLVLRTLQSPAMPT